MTWLLNQFQKVINTFKKGSQVEKEKGSSAIANRLSNDLSSQRQSDIDAPVALRESSPPPAKTPDPAEPAMHSSLVQGAIVPPTQPELVPNDLSTPVETVVDTHQRLDIAPAALPGETITAPGFPTEVSDLISSPEGAPIELKPVYKDEQPPEIHDLLPAIEPDETDSELAEASTAQEVTDLPAAPPQAESDITVLEQQNMLHLPEDKPVIEPAERVSAEEEITLFSFNITESQEPQLKEPQSKESHPIESHPEKVELAEKIGQPEHAPDSVAEKSKSLERSVQPSVQLQEISPQPSTEPHGDEEPVNPWLSAVPAKHRTAVTSSIPVKTTSQLQTKEQKVGIVKLLFKIKQGNFHGYIAPHDGSKDILFHQKYINADIFDQIERGSEVTASIQYIEGKAYATHVSLS